MTSPLRRSSDQQPVRRRQILGAAAGAALAGTAVSVGFGGATPAAAAQPAAPSPAGAPNRAGTPSGAGTPVPAPVPVPLDALYDNDGIDTATAHGGSFDGSGYTFPGEVLTAGPVTVGGVPYLLGPSTAGANNNVVALGQRIALPAGHYLSALFLVAGSYGAASGTAVVGYADGTTTQAAMVAPDWYGAGGALTAPYRYTPSGAQDPNPVSLWFCEVDLDPARQAVALTLPTTAAPAPNVTSMHVFALSLQAAAQGRAVIIRDARCTNALLGGSAPQTVEATVVNAGSVWLTAADQVTVSVEVAGARTTVPAGITRLAPGEQARVRIGIAPGAGNTPGTSATGDVAVDAKGGRLATRSTGLILGVPDYQPTDSSLAAHQAPYWFDDAKFGIFIHWGVYSVPAWGPVGKEYAEWYWDHMQDPNDPTYAYHAQTYGQSFNYDDFIPRFTAEKFQPTSWVRLFEDAGAEYFVLTSKHHEGFALWDSKVSDRNAVKLGPHRDLVKDLFDASRTHTPGLHNGLYYSLPEWFNPDNPWMGHAPRNPYTLAPVPYTGYQSGRDYVKDYQTKQVLELVEGYDPDIIWYDIGGANDTRDVLAEYFNRAKNRPRPKDVTVDNRGGIPAHDFTTPEYTTYPNTVVAKWEASRGLDPFSYGYNSATPDSQYMTGEQVVQTLVDIVSKNGNFLLDIGPKADGTIPAIMQRVLLDTGAWLRVNGEAVYGTTYWSRMAQLGELRFTVKQNEAFYIHSFAQPGDTLVVQAPVPIRPSDRITLLGYHGRPLNWSIDTSGSLVIEVPRAAQRSGLYDWVFKIA
ncbi:alpha-L-fucosidase [Streptacidiphilus sp. EB129]|uniref:alpha-L-fucosidase n=1 Tax=Streptacidiphilus sp. EB129 TaxID=3156262 RepID=UPI003518BC9F